MSVRDLPSRRSAPHPRGWSGGLAGYLVPIGVGPAPAGMVLTSVRCLSPLPCRPRTRGDGPIIQDRRAALRESAPHPRGWSLFSDCRAGKVSVGPAPARMVLGKTPGS